MPRRGTPRVARSPQAPRARPPIGQRDARFRASPTRAREGRLLGFSLGKRRGLDAAKKYLQKGAYDKALKEYLALLQADPNDAGLRLKIADIHVKRGDIPAAVEAYVGAARQFEAQGFDPKAVAVLKQVLRLDPSKVECRVRLGEIYHRMGLRAEALRELGAAADAYLEQGRRREAFDVLKRMADLDPANLANRLRLAELLAREGLEGEAAEIYAAALAELEGRRDAEGVVRVAQAWLEIAPGDRRPALALVAALRELGRIEEALEPLAQAHEARPDDPELLERLAATLEELGREEEARARWRALVGLLRERGEEERARDLVQRLGDPVSLGPDVTDPSLVLEEALDTRDAVALGEPEAEADAELGVNERLAEGRLAWLLDDVEGAESIVHEVLAAVPDHPRAQLLAADVALARGDLERARSWLEACRELAAAAGRADILAGVEQRLRALAAPAPRGASGISPDAGPTPQAVAGSTPIGVDGGRDGGRASAAPAAEDELPDIEIELVDVEPTGSDLEEPDAGEAGAGEDEAAEGWEIPVELEAGELAPAGDAAGASEAGAEAPIELGASLEEPADAEAEGPEAPGTAEAARPLEALLREAERAIAEGDLDRAEALAREVLARVPGHPAALVRLGEVAAARRSEAGGATAAGFLGETAVAEPEPAGPEPAPAAGGPPCAAEAATAEPEGGDFDLAAALEDALEALDPAASRGGAVEGGEESFAEVFRAFKRGIETQLDPGDARARYDLAIAYLEMGLLEDAAAELERAARCGPSIEILSTLGEAYRRLGRFDEAERVLRGALRAAPDPRARVPLWYELARLEDARGDRVRALGWLAKVAAVDPDFRDTRAWMASLDEEGAE